MKFISAAVAAVALVSTVVAETPEEYQARKTATLAARKAHRAAQVAEAFTSEDPAHLERMKSLFESREKLWNLNLEDLPAGPLAVQLAYAHRTRGTFPDSLNFDEYVTRTAPAVDAAVVEPARNLQSCTPPFALDDYSNYVATRPCINTSHLESSQFWAFNHPCFYPYCDVFHTFYPYCGATPEVVWADANWEVCWPPSNYDYISASPTGCPGAYDISDWATTPGFAPPGDITCVPQWNGTNPYNFMLDPY